MKCALRRARLWAVFVCAVVALPFVLQMQVLRGNSAPTPPLPNPPLTPTTPPAEEEEKTKDYLPPPPSPTPAAAAVSPSSPSARKRIAGYERCYGPCFSQKSCGPETGCRYACDFVPLSQKPTADMYFSELPGSKMDPRKPPGPPDQLITLFVGESPANYRPIQDEAWAGLHNYSIGYRAADTFPLRNGVLVKQVFAGIDALEAATGSRGPPVSFVDKHTRKMMSVWISNTGFVRNNRGDVLKALEQNGVTTASYGRAYHNAEPWIAESSFTLPLPPDRAWTDANGDKPMHRHKAWISAHHLFLFAAENSDCDSYHTEKVWAALLAGSIPVYLGGKTIRDVVPTHSTIVARDFDSPAELAKYIHQVATNETLYNSFMEWRYRKPDPQVQQLIDERDAWLRGEFDCRVCTFVHERPPGKLKPDTSCLPPWYVQSQPTRPPFALY